MDADEIAARLANDPNRPDREELWAQLMPVVRGAARALVSRGSFAEERSDFEDASFQVIQSKIDKFDPSRRPGARFRPWCRKVLLHDLIDRQRKRRPGRLSEAAAAALEVPAVGRTDLVEFGPKDLERMERSVRKPPR